MQSNPWRKAPEDLQQRFADAAAGIDGMEQRQMFGYPAGFIGGNLTTSLHQESWIVRLPDAERQECLDAGWSVFEPMPGRPMRGYVALPDEVAADPDQARAWVERAAAFVRTLPPKVPKPKKSKATTA
jgi:TfoX/Sxy family transcriptional regulator of competence genes